MSPSQQPQLIVAVSNGYLVFIGLVVAASASILASDRAAALPVWARWGLAFALTIGVASGVAALIGGNAGHNLGRRSEKLEAARNSPLRQTLEADVANARKVASRSIYWALTGAMVSATALAAALVAVVLIGNDAARSAPSARPEPLDPPAPAFEWLGDIRGFAPAQSQIVDVNTERSAEAIRDRWCTRRRAGRHGLLLVVGATDQTPLRGAARRRFETNAGLAQARANAVAGWLFPSAPPGVVVALPAGPAAKPPDGLDPHFAGEPADRRVSVWAFWRSAAKGEAIPECPA